jgi:hypothetical protein
MGPVPDVEDYVPIEWKDLKVGGVQLPAVLAYEAKI